MTTRITTPSHTLSFSPSPLLILLYTLLFILSTSHPLIHSLFHPLYFPGIFERMTVINHHNRSLHDPLDETKQLSSNAAANEYRFKSCCRVDPNDTFTPFLVWKTHITRLLLDSTLSGLLSTPFARFYLRRNSNVMANRRPSAAPSLLTVLELTAENGDDGDDKIASFMNTSDDKGSGKVQHGEASTTTATTATTALSLPLLKAVSGKNSNRSGRGTAAGSKNNSLRVINGGGVTAGTNSRKGSEGRTESGSSNNINSSNSSNNNININNININNGNPKASPTTRLKSKPKRSELLHANLKALCDKMEEEDPSLTNMLPMLHSLLGIHTSRGSMEKTEHAAAAAAGAGVGIGSGSPDGGLRKGVGVSPLTGSLEEYSNEIVPLLVRLIMCVADVLGGPLLFVIDDSQAMDGSSWALLRHLWKCCNGHQMTSRSTPNTHKGDNHRASHTECHTSHPTFRKATVSVLLTFRTMSEHHHDYNDEHIIAGTLICHNHNTTLPNRTPTILMDLC